MHRAAANRGATGYRGATGNRGCSTRGRNRAVMAPALLLDFFAAIMLAVAAISAARLVAARQLARPTAHADTDGAHLLMSVAMAGMLVAGLRTLPSGAWEVVFAVLTAWFAGRVGMEARRGPAPGPGSRPLTGAHHVPHLVHSAAMLYMFLALGAPGRGTLMAGMNATGGAGTLQLPTLALAFALLLSGLAVADLDHLSSRTEPVRPHTRLSIDRTPPLALVTAGGATAPNRTPPSRAAQETAAINGDRDSRAASVDPSGHRLLDRRFAAGCRIAMGITMTLMLMIMI
jgi:hypothetical protein